jgi:hypothetical protein
MCQSLWKSASLLNTIGTNQFYKHSHPNFVLIKRENYNLSNVIIMDMITTVQKDAQTTQMYIRSIIQAKNNRIDK